MPTTQTVEEKTSVKVGLIRRSLMVYAVIFVLWGLYRLLVRFPIFLEEVFFKPLVFLPPALAMLEREKTKKTLIGEAFGWNREGISLAIYFGLTIGITYFFMVATLGLLVSGWGNLDISGINQGALLNMFLVAAATAVWEQMLFCGFFLLRFQKAFHNEWNSVGLTACLFTFLHFPILFFDAQTNPGWIAAETGLLFLVGCGNAVLMLRTKNILGPILAYTFLALAFQLVG